jgi:kynureninase
MVTLCDTKQAYTTDEQQALRLDAQDPLGSIRERFYLPPGAIYMDGNSLGLLSRDAEQSLLRVLEEWKSLGIDGWMHGEIPWFHYAEELAKLQAPLLGAEADEVILHSSTTVNIHALMATFFSPDTSRHKVLMDELTFPSDRYAIESQSRLKGLDPAAHLALVPSRDGRTIEETDVIDRMAEDVALVFLPSVLYRSGQLLDVATLTAEAHRRGILIGFDCAHSVGAVPHSLSEWQVDFACWCTYKYCNSGPGGVAGLYVNRKHFGRTPGLAGWFGYRKDRQFDLRNVFEPAPNAGAWQIGTPHVLSLAPLEGSLRIYQEVGIQAVREKSLRLTAYLMSLIDQELAPHGFTVGTPRDPARRGGHVALEHEDAVQINQALKARGVLPDFRPPNIIRLAPIALYTSYHEVYQVVQTIREIIETGAHRQYPQERGLVA